MLKPQGSVLVQGQLTGPEVRIYVYLMTAKVVKIVGPLQILNSEVKWSNTGLNISSKLIKSSRHHPITIFMKKLLCKSKIALLKPLLATPKDL